MSYPNLKGNVYCANCLKRIETSCITVRENPSDRTTGCPTEQHLEINKDGTSNTLTSVQKDNYVVSKPPFRIRKLTPLECFRLQGFPDELFYKAQEVNSDSQLYKQAGNSVTVPVIYDIARRLV